MEVFTDILQILVYVYNSNRTIYNNKKRQEFPVYGGENNTVGLKGTQQGCIKVAHYYSISSRCRQERQY